MRGEVKKVRRRSLGLQGAGTSPTDVAKSLIEDGIRRAIKEEWLDKEDVRKVQRPE